MSELRKNPTVAAATAPVSKPAQPAPATVRVARYRRTSAAEGTQPDGLDAQEQVLTTFIASRPGWVQAGDYVESASGKNVTGRPQLQRLLGDAAAGKFDVVVVARIDRWSCDLHDLLGTIAVLSDHNVAFQSATEPFDTSTPMGKMPLQMLALFAEHERAMSDRIIRGNDAKIAQGKPLNSRVGFGLRVKDTGFVELDPATADTVQRIFTEYVTEQKATTAIAEGLNESGLPSPGGRLWSPNSVSRVLRNRSFVGELWHRDKWHAGTHEPLLDETLFAEAQAIQDARAAGVRANLSRADDRPQAQVRAARPRRTAAASLTRSR